MNENNNGKNGKNAKQDLTIVSIQKDIEWLIGEMKDIKRQVMNDIPHSIKALEKRMNELQLAHSRQFVGLLISIIGLLIATIVNILI